MKTKNKILIFTLIIMGMFLVLLNSCFKSDSTTNTINTLPVLTTTVVTAIGPSTATSGGTITSGGGSAVTARGICCSTSQSFTVDNCLKKTTDSADVGNYVSYLTGLKFDTTYYVRAYATNTTGTGYGNLLSFKTLTPPYYIGQSYGGGIVFYLDSTGLHGLISATSDQSTHANWGCVGTLIGGLNIGTAIGMGQANTLAIITACSDTGIAASICHNLALNGHNDWFLPSKDELTQLFNQRNVVGGFASYYYWSSSQYDANNADYQDFYLQYISSYRTKNTAGCVRAIRAF
jgi:hypothetical protein